MTQQDPQLNRPPAARPVQPPSAFQGEPAGQAGQQWYFVTHQGREGPVDKASLEAMIRGRALHPETLVWRPGMDQWEAADLLPEFDTLMRSLPPDVYSIAGQVAAQKTTKNVRANCITMFVIFVLSTPIIAIAALQEDSSHSDGAWIALAVLMFFVAAVVSVFAVIYIPVRWRQIQQQSRVTKTLGLIGAGGLIATVLVVMIVGLLF